MDADLEDRIAHDRALKATDLFLHLERLQCTAAQAAHLTLPERRAVERQAGTRKASDDKTWPIVVEMLARSERFRALCVTCGLGDPQGVPGPRKVSGHEGECSR